MKENQAYYAVVRLEEGAGMGAAFRRTIVDGVHGMLLQKPKIGEKFFMYLSGGERYLRTSTVRNIRENANGTVHVQTNHSIYVLSDIKEAMP